MICKNCNNNFIGVFCGVCGQSEKMNNRLSFKELFVDVLHSIFHTGSGLFFTLKLLLTNPKKVISGFINGKRKVFFSPIKLFLISSIIYLYAVHFVNKGVVDNETKEIEYFLKNYKYVLVFSPVFVTAILNKIFYFRLKLNFTEHFVIILYIQTIIYIITSLSMILNYFLNIKILIYSIIICLIYYVYSATLYFKKRKVISLIILNSFIYIISFFLHILPVFLFNKFGQ